MTEHLVNFLPNLCNAKGMIFRTRNLLLLHKDTIFTVTTANCKRRGYVEQTYCSTKVLNVILKEPNKKVQNLLGEQVRCLTKKLTL